MYVGFLPSFEMFCCSGVVAGFDQVLGGGFLSSADSAPYSSTHGTLMFKLTGVEQVCGLADGLFWLWLCRLHACSSREGSVPPTEGFFEPLAQIFTLMDLSPHPPSYTPICSRVSPVGGRLGKLVKSEREKLTLNR